MTDRDPSYLEDMISYASDAIELLAGADAVALSSDKMRRYAVIRAAEIVGEAASNVSAPRRATLTGVPWRAVIGMRNVLIHGYTGLDLNILVDTVRNHFPVLIGVLRDALGEGSS
ncbi:MAG TPA: HepT-like ribonuclease domain-containing protein [Caulobacteraceae bacterium]|jgi:uncharacterized protein with HEPN domain|nr:HepT-like ribonuclease domain-containing protein [Caulobacteraceae bacterium]